MIKFITDTEDRHVAFEARTDTAAIKAVYRGNRYDHSLREWMKKTRVYEASTVLAPELMRLEPFANNYGEGYLSIPLAGPDRSVEDDVRAAMWNAWKRETTKVTAARLIDLLKEVLPAAEEEYGAEYPLPTASPKWSRTAGCTCPCSPGFTLDVRLVHDHRPIDFYMEPLRPE